MEELQVETEERGSGVVKTENCVGALGTNLQNHSVEEQEVLTYKQRLLIYTKQQGWKDKYFYKQDHQFLEECGKLVQD